MSTDAAPKFHCVDSSFAKRTCSTIASAKQDIDLARQQCSTANTLRQRKNINAIQVARSVVEAVDAGMRLPGEDAVLGLPFARPLTDEAALGLWAMFLAPYVRAANPTRLKGRSGFLDFPREVRDAAGQPLGRDGKPLPIVTTEHIGPDGKTYYGWERTGELATDRDNLDEVQLLEVERRIAADWSDLFVLLIESVEEHVPPAVPSSEGTPVGVEAERDTVTTPPAAPSSGAKPVKRRFSKHRKSLTESNLTDKQMEAVHIVGECKGNIAEAARRLGKDYSTIKQHYDAATAKLGKRAVKHSTEQHATDRRGQANIATDSDKRH